MKKGISIWSFPESRLVSVFTSAKRAGFDGVEIALSRNGEICLSLTQTEAEEIRALADRCGIQLYSIATSMFWETPLTSPDPSTRDHAEAILRKQLDIAAWLGCDTVLAVPGIVDEKTSYTNAYDRALDAMKRLAPYAEAKQVVIGVENVWNRFLLSPLEMKGFIDKVGSPYVRAYFDVGNVVRDGYPEQWIRILASRIAKVHIKDYRRADGTINGFVDLLKGDTDFMAVATALSEIDYNGWVTAELSPPQSLSFDKWLLNVSETIDIIFGGRQTK